MTWNSSIPGVSTPLNDDGRPFIIDRAVAEALAYFSSRRSQSAQRNAQRINQYGGKGILKYNPSVSETTIGIRQQITLVDWQSEDGMPHNMTVSIGRIDSGGGGTFPTGVLDGVSLAYRCYAQVIIGTPSAMQDPFFIDIGRGQKFTTTASYVAVTAVMPPPPTGFSSGSIPVVGNIGYGTAPTLAPVLYTQYIDNQAADTTSAPLIIPPKANFIQPIRSSSATNVMRLRVYDNAGTLIDNYTFTNGQTIAPNVGMFFPLELPGDAYSLTLYSLEASNSRIVYQISA